MHASGFHDSCDCVEHVVATWLDDKAAMHAPVLEDSGLQCVTLPGVRRICNVSSNASNCCQAACVIPCCHTIDLTALISFHSTPFSIGCVLPVAVQHGQMFSEELTAPPPAEAFGATLCILSALVKEVIHLTHAEKHAGKFVKTQDRNHTWLTHTKESEESGRWRKCGLQTKAVLGKLDDPCLVLLDTVINVIHCHQCDTLSLHSTGALFPNTLATMSVVMSHAKSCTIHQSV